MKKLIVVIICVVFLLIIVNCNSYHPEVQETICVINPEVPTIQDANVCIESIKCGSTVSSYLCFCDKICLCFFSVSKNCNSIYDRCGSGGAMLIVDGKFCILNNKRDLLLKLYEDINNEIFKTKEE